MYRKVVFYDFIQKLFLLMEEQEITKEKLKNKIGISSATMAKLSKNEDVSMSTIQSLCDFFDCQPGAILSYEKKLIKYYSFHTS